MPTTELDNLKLAWQSLSQQLEKQRSLTRREFQTRKLEHFRGGFRPLVLGQTIQIFCGTGLELYGGNFWFEHRSTPHLLAYGVLLQLYGLLLILPAARDLFLICRIDYAAPILTIQKQLAALREWHRRSGLLFTISGCLMWTPLVLVIFHAGGLDLWTTKPALVGWFVLSSLLCLALSCGLVLWSRRPGQEKLAQLMRDSPAGKTVLRAESILREIEEFERE